MTQVALQYAVGSKLSDAFPSDMRVNGWEIIADVDSTETPYTADYTIGPNDQSMAFLVLSGATNGTMTVELYHGTTHAAAVPINALVQAGHDGLKAPAASVVLDLTTAEDRKALILVNPGARESNTVWLGANNKVSLKLSADANYTDNTSVVVVALTGAKRHIPGPGPV